MESWIIQMKAFFVSSQWKLIYRAQHNLELPQWPIAALFKWVLNKCRRGILSQVPIIPTSVVKPQINQSIHQLTFDLKLWWSSAMLSYQFNGAIKLWLTTNKMETNWASRFIPNRSHCTRTISPWHPCFWTTRRGSLLSQPWKRGDRINWA